MNEMNWMVAVGEKHLEVVPVKDPKLHRPGHKCWCRPFLDKHVLVHNWETQMTPEGRVKRDIKRILKAFGVHYDMPVTHGFGRAAVDFHCCVRGPLDAIAFYIEAKEEGKKPTPLQNAFLRNRREQQDAKTFVIDGDAGIKDLVEWLQDIEKLCNEVSANEYPLAAIARRR